MKRAVIAGVLALGLSAPVFAEIVESNTFRAETQRRALSPLKDGTAMTQAFVSVSTKAGRAPAPDAQQDAAGFAAAAGCRAGEALSVVVARSTDFTTEFEVLCKGGR